MDLSSQLWPTGPVATTRDWQLRGGYVNHSLSWRMASARLDPIEALVSVGFRVPLLNAIRLGWPPPRQSVC